MDLILFLLVLLEGLLMLVIFFVGVIAIYFAFNSGFMYNPPPVPTTGKVKEAIIADVAKILNQKKHQIVMDLGSGWGTLLLPLAKKFSHHKFIGIEYGYIPYWISKFRARKLNNIVFYHQNFFHADVSKADIVLMFLLPHKMTSIGKKCQKETKKGTLLYVNRFKIPQLKAIKTQTFGSKYDTYYVYKM